MSGPFLRFDPVRLDGLPRLQSKGIKGSALGIQWGDSGSEKSMKRITNRAG
jgi:hypothetical protein